MTHDIKDWKTATVAGVKKAIEQGVDVNSTNDCGGTPLMEASRWSKDPEIIKTLIAAGADVNARDPWGDTPLNEAVNWNKNPDIAKTLLANGAQPTKDMWGGTTLMLACSNGNSSDVVMALIETGADIYAQNGWGKTAWDHIQTNDRLKGTPAYHKLKELQTQETTL